jgi:hypothetical protein
MSSLGPLGQPNFDYAFLLNAVEEENVCPTTWQPARSSSMSFVMESPSITTLSG